MSIALLSGLPSGLAFLIVVVFAALAVGVIALIGRALSHDEMEAEISHGQSSFKLKTKQSTRAKRRRVAAAKGRRAVAVKSGRHLDVENSRAGPGMNKPMIDSPAGHADHVGGDDRFRR